MNLSPSEGIRSVLVEKVHASFENQKRWKPSQALLPSALESASNARFLTKDSPELGRHPTDVVELKPDLTVKIFDPSSPGDARRQAFQVLRNQVMSEAKQSVRDPYLHARQLHSLGELVEASFHYDKAARIEAEKDKPRPEVLLDSALIHAKLFRFDTAKRDLEMAVTVCYEAGLNQSFICLEALSNLASVMAWKGSGQEAVNWCHLALELAELGSGGGETNAPRLKILLANILFSEGSVDEADKVLAEVERGFPTQLCHSLLHAQAQNDLSQLRCNIALKRGAQKWRKRVDLSQPYERQMTSLDFRQGKGVCGDPAVLESHINMAALLKEGREYDAALSYSSEAIHLAGLNTFSENHFVFIYLNNNKAAVLERLGDKAEALRLLVEAHSLASQYFSDNHPLTVNILRNLRRVSGGKP